MTTLAIIGGGIAGRSLIYTLAKEQKAFDQIVLFGSESFFKACSYRSTAVVAGRGLTLGHSELGDTLFEAYKLFEQHFKQDAPVGIEKAMQLTGVTKKLDEFIKRYPDGELSSEFTQERLYLQKDEAYLVDPQIYLNFLLNEALRFYQNKLTVVDDLVLEVSPEGRLRTQLGGDWVFDKIVFAAGAYSRFWAPLAPESKLKTIKASQGSYLEFFLPDQDSSSVSMSLDSYNYIWNNKTKILLIGSTTLEVSNELHPERALFKIHSYFKQNLNLLVPDLAEGKVRVGLREKAQRRAPYLFGIDKNIFMGGLYKNGYTLGLSLSKKVVRDFF